MKRNYLNPFRNENIFCIILAESAEVTVELFNEIGEKVFTILEKQNLPEGEQQIKFKGNQLEPGVYYAAVTIENFRETQVRNRTVHIS